MILSYHCCCGLGHLFVRNISIFSARDCNPYKVLGLSSKATQSEIKAAFYELSKKHHPDKNQGCEKSAKKFKDITAAYEILRNEKLRSKFDIKNKLYNEYDSNFNYDKQFSHHRTANSNTRTDYNDEAERYYYEKTFRVKNRKFYGKTSHFDYDAWFKGHYGSQFKNYQYQNKSKTNYQKPIFRYIKVHKNHLHKSHIIVLGMFMTYIYFFLKQK